MVWAEEVAPTVCVPKMRLEGDSEAPGAVDTPVPDKLTACGLPVASSVIENVPVLEPEVVGVKVTENEQLPPARTVPPQVLVFAKSPVMPVEAIVSVAVPVFVRVTVCAAEVIPTVSDPNAKLPVENETAGAVPVPESATVCGLPEASSAIDKVPLLAPVVVGVKVTVKVQLAEGAKVALQVVVLAKSPLAAVEEMLRVAVPTFVKVTVWPPLVVPTT
jgi:hypothetical protein